MDQVVGIIISHNPNLTKFQANLNSLINEVNHVVVVDNASSNISGITILCRKMPNCNLIKLGFNSGVAYALMRGVRYAVVNYSPDWLLFLDDDTVVLDGAVRRALGFYEGLPRPVRDRVGLIKLGSENGDCKVYEILYGGAFSGTLIKSGIA